jgi:hypothetical protein
MEPTKYKAEQVRLQALLEGLQPTDVSNKFIKEHFAEGRACKVCGHESKDPKRGILNHIKACHIDTHFNEKGEKCPLCPDTSERFDSFIRHYQEVHGLTRQEINEKGLKKTSKHGAEKRTKGMLSKSANEKRRETYRKRYSTGSSEEISAEECMEYIDGESCKICGYDLEEGKPFKKLYEHVRKQHIEPKRRKEGDMCPICKDPSHRYLSFSAHLKECHGLTDTQVKNNYGGSLVSKGTKEKMLKAIHNEESNEKRIIAHKERRIKSDEELSWRERRVREISSKEVEQFISTENICSVCGFKGKDKSSAISHYKRMHMLPKECKDGIVCPICKDPNEQFYDVRVHLEQCHSISKEEAFKRFSTEELFSKKMREQSSENFRSYYAIPENRSRHAEITKERMKDLEFLSHVKAKIREYYQSEKGKIETSNRSKLIWKMHREKILKSLRELYDSQEGIDMARKRMENNPKFQEAGTNASGGYSGCYQGIKFESLIELGFIKRCKDHKLRVSRCDLKIPYLDTSSSKYRTYNPDFIVGDVVVEIKHSHKVAEYEKNQCKFAAAREYCRSNNMEFRYHVNNDIFKNKKERKEFLDWAITSPEVSIKDFIKR